MPYFWDRAKAEDVNVKTWRPLQIEQYIKIHPNHEPRDVLDWLKSQNPNPWPTCDPNNLGKIIRRVRNTVLTTQNPPLKKHLSVCR